MKGLLLSLKAFVPTAAETGGAVLALTSQAVAFPVTHVPGASGYIASKLAQIKVIEYLAAENPALFAAAVHPGICDTAVLAKSGIKPHEVPLDRCKPSSLHVPHSPSCNQNTLALPRKRGHRD